MNTDLPGVFLVYRWRQKFRPVRSRVPLKPEVDRRGTVTPSSQPLDLVLTERTPIVLKEKLTRTEAGQRYSEVFQLRSTASPRDWPRVAAIEAFRYCHSQDHASDCPNRGESTTADCSSHWGTLCDGYEEGEGRLRRDVYNGVAKTIVARETVARGTVAKGDIETVPVVPPQRVYSSPDVVAVVGRKMADGKCPD